MPETEKTDSIVLTPSSAGKSEKPQIDLQALAERVFGLMKQDALIQRERQPREHPNPGEVRHGR